MAGKLRAEHAHDAGIVNGGVSWHRYNLLVIRAHERSRVTPGHAQVLATLALAEATVLAATTSPPPASS